MFFYALDSVVQTLIGMFHDLWKAKNTCLVVHIFPVLSSSLPTSRTVGSR